MKNIASYLDSTYLKTPEQSGLTPEATLEKIKELIQEAIQYQMKLVMIRPEHVLFAKQMLNETPTHVLVGTVIDFPNGDGGLTLKLADTQKAISDGADELDFVIDYKKFSEGERDTVKNEFVECTALGLEAGKTVKWIIEAAALSDDLIIELCDSIRSWAEKFQGQEDKIFIKSSTGFFQTPDGKPNGATPHNIQLIKSHAGNLPIKAAGGVRSYEEAVEMIHLGVSRIGTSSAKEILEGKKASEGY